MQILVGRFRIKEECVPFHSNPTFIGMKSLSLLFAIIISSLSVSAQFEGTISMGIKMEITDPKAKADMEKMKQLASSPEAKKQLQQMEAQMNDPKFKEVLDKNPEMKKMIEAQLNAMKGGNGGNIMENMVPKSIEIKVRNGNSLSVVKGGAFESEILYLKEKGKSFTLDRKNKTYAAEPEYKNEAETVTVKKTEEFLTLLGHKCRRFVVEVSEKQKVKNTFDVWTTDEINGLTSKDFANLKMSASSHKNYFENVEGVALRVLAKMPQGTMQMDVLSLKKESLPESLFQIPAGFTERSY